MRVQVGGLDVVTLLGAIAGIGCGAVAGCHCWVPLLGAIARDRGGGGRTSWGIGCGDVAGSRCWVPLLGAIAGLPLLGAIAGDRGGVVHVGGLDVHVGGLDVVPLLAAIAGDRGWVYKLADWMW